MMFAQWMQRIAVAAVAALASALAAQAAPMTFRMMPVGDGCGARCPLMIVAEGEITPRTPDDFAAFVRQASRDAKARSVILLHSQGGRVGASMQLGKHFRSAGAAVIVGRAGQNGVAPGHCYSACVYALMGAKKRVVPPVSRVGIHRMVAFDAASRNPDDMNGYQAIFATPDLVNRLSDYAGSMGVSRELILTAERTRHDRLRVLTPQEIRRWNLGSERF